MDLMRLDLKEVDKEIGGTHRARELRHEDLS